MHNAPTGESPHKGKTGLKRLWNALFYTFDGMRAAFRHEDAFRQEVFLAVLLIPAALFTPASGLGKALMIADGVQETGRRDILSIHAGEVETERSGR